MKISVCIPVYNFDIKNLVIALRTEIQTNQIDAEIILIDDTNNPPNLEKIIEEQKTKNRFKPRRKNIRTNRYF